MSIDKLKQLTEMINLVDEGISQADFLKNFQIIIDLIKKLKESNRIELETIDGKYDQVIKEVERQCNNKIIESEQYSKNYYQVKVKEILDSLDSRVTNLRKECTPDTYTISLEASKIAQSNVLPLIPTIDAIEKDLPRLGVEIRDALELLQGDDRLDYTAIKGLEDFMLKCSNNKVMGGGINMSGMNLHFVDDETPTNSGDNLNFTINYIPSPTSSLKVFRNGQRIKITEDYTFVGKTITLLTALEATEILLVDYRI